MAPAMPKVKTAVKEFLRDVPPQDQVTLLASTQHLHADAQGDRSGRAQQGGGSLAPWDRPRSTTCCCAASNPRPADRP